MFCVRKKRSIIWNFMKVDSSNPTCHVCQLCDIRIVALGNTSNSRRHLEEAHNKVWTKALKKEVNDGEGESSSGTESVNSVVSTLGLSSAVETSTKKKETKKKRKGEIQSFLKRKLVYSQNNPKKKKHDENLARMIAEDFEPYSIVQRSGFKRFIEGFDPRYTFPDRTTISKSLMPKLYQKVEDKLKERLKHSKY